MIADQVCERLPQLVRREFCVGNVAPDCNVENEDWTAFVPSREETHWMSGERKGAADCERFWQQCIEDKAFDSREEQSFYLGYYSHLVTDACFQKFIRGAQRVKNMFERIQSRPEMAVRMQDFAHDFDGVKQAFSKRERLRDVDAMEYEYLQKNPQSGFLTVLRTLEDFPDYLDHFPKGAIVRKMGVMAKLPDAVENPAFVFFSREEYSGFVKDAIENIVHKLSGYFA